MPKAQPDELEDRKDMRWSRRDQKQRPRMRLHGQGMKKLAARLGEKKTTKATAPRKKKSARSRTRG